MLVANLAPIPLPMMDSNPTAASERFIRALLDGPFKGLGEAVGLPRGLSLTPLRPDQSEKVAIRSDFKRVKYRNTCALNSPDFKLSFRSISVPINEESHIQLLLGPFCISESHDQEALTDQNVVSLSKARLEELVLRIETAATLLLESASIGMEFCDTRRISLDSPSDFRTCTHLDPPPEINLGEPERFGLEERIHESRATIAAIQGHAELLLAELETQGHPFTEEQRDAIRIIARRSGQLASLFTPPLHDAVGARRATDPDLITPLSNLIEDLASLLHPDIERKKLHLEVQLNEDAHSLPTEAPMMTTILRNLLENAVRHAPLYGTIRLSASTVGRDSLELSVEDGGRGVPRPLRAHIFKRGHRGEGSRGDGIGLALVNDIVEARGGTISVDESEALGGARFRVRLPLTLR